MTPSSQDVLLYSLPGPPPLLDLNPRSNPDPSLDPPPQDVLFYSLPEHAGFYSEILNLLETDGLPAAAAAAGGPTHAGVSALFCKYDVLQLERVVGTGRARKMVAPGDSSTFMFC